jgi:hypothetical protein
MYQIHNFENYNREEFFNFLKIEVTRSKDPAACNMWSDNWIFENNTLPYILERSARFKEPNGQFFILTHNEKIIGCSGVYESQFNPNIAIAGVRTWIDQDYRNNSINREYLLPAQKKWAEDKGYKIIALTFNDYNKNIIQIFKRNRLGEKNNRLGSREPYHLFYNGLNEVDFPVVIQHTPQWVIYEKLDPSWEYDWGNISATK